MGIVQCVGLGVYRKRSAFIVGRCKKGLHELAEWNLGRLKSGVVYCRACRHLYRARLYWSEALDQYWRVRLKLLPVLADTQHGASSGRWSNKDGPAVPYFAGETQPSRVCQPAEAG